MRKLRAFTSIPLVLTISLHLILSCLASTAMMVPELDPPTLLQDMQKDDNVTVIISIRNCRLQEIREAEVSSSWWKSTDSDTRWARLHEKLKSYTESVQRPVLSVLESARKSTNPTMTINPLFISNQIVAFHAGRDVIQSLLTLPEVSKISKERYYKIPLEANVARVDPFQQWWKVPNKALTLGNWGLGQIRAESAWRIGCCGQGVRAGTLDTGLYAQHDCFKGGRIASEYNFANFVNDRTDIHDDNNHGSHVACILAGTYPHGVAPCAQLMAAKVCDSKGSCGSGAILSGCQWMAAPTVNGVVNLSMRPRVLSMSIGGLDIAGSSNLIDNWMDPCFKALTAANILLVAAAGNNPLAPVPLCSTIAYPGNSPQVYSVGSTGPQDKMSSFSCRGTGLSTTPGQLLVKPDGSAPGENINSALTGSPTSYGPLSGTSMATPFVSGLAAILISSRPDAKLEDIKGWINAGAIPVCDTCSKLTNPVGDCKVPNVDGGHGRIDMGNTLGQMGMVSCPTDSCSTDVRDQVLAGGTK